MHKRFTALVLVLLLCLSLCPASAFALDLGGAEAVGSEAAEEVTETPAAAAAEDGDKASGTYDALVEIQGIRADEGGLVLVTETGERLDSKVYKDGDVITGLPWGVRTYYMLLPVEDTFLSYQFLGGEIGMIPDSSILYVTSPGDNAQATLHALYISTESEYDGSSTSDVEVGASSGKCGVSATYSYADGVLTISGSGSTYDFGFQDDDDHESYYDGTPPWDSWKASIRKVVVQSGITKIGAKAFQACENLTEVSLPKGLKSIFDSAFEGCIKLSSVKLPSTLERIRPGAFSNSGLTTLQIPDSVTKIDDSFTNCSNLTYFRSGSGTAELESLVSNCPKLVTAVIAEGVQRMAGTFYMDTALEEVYLPVSLTYVDWLTFAECDSLTDIYYAGSRSQWSQITITKHNESLDGVTIHYNVGAPEPFGAPELSISCTASTGKPKLDWEPVAGAAKYEIWRATSKSGEYSKVYTTSYSHYTHTGAVAGKTYYFKVRSVTSGGTVSEFSPVVYATCDCAQPSFSISCVASSGKPRLTWSAVSGAVEYEVWRAYSKNGTYYKMGTTSGTSYTNSSAEAGTTYYYKLYAIGTSSYSKSAASTVKNITCDYARPSVSISTNPSTGKPKLTWSAVSGATKYEIWRATSRTGTYTKIYTTSNTYFNNTTATANKSYYYKVRAIGSSSYATSAYSSIVSITCDCAKPVVTATTNSSGKPRLSWGAVDGAVKYEIWRSGYRNGTYTKIYTTTNTYFNNTSAGSGYTYFYKVRAVGSSSYATSAYSSIVSAKATK